MMKRRRFHQVLGASALALAAPASLMAEEYGSGREIYHAMQTQPLTTIEFPGSRIDVAIVNPISATDRERVFAWIRKSADALIAYYGHYPEKHAGILVIVNGGNRIGHGVSYGYGGSVIRVDFGTAIDPEVLANDWVMIHEMVHLSFPVLADEHLWLMEGSATYIEPVARGRAGQRSSISVWDEFFHNMGKGMPDEDEKGLDITHTWGRTYWGGAIFCLYADVRAREANGNRAGLADAMRAINAKSGGNSVEWSIEEVIQTGDAATGTQTLAQLYKSMGQAHHMPDLEVMFARLGVVADGDTIRFDDSAPLAAIRHAITDPAKKA
jgi:hypothetical protein